MKIRMHFLKLPHQALSVEDPSTPGLEEYAKVNHPYFILTHFNKRQDPI